MDLVHGPLERGVIALLRDHAVQFFQKTGNLLVGQFLLEGQQGIQICPQHPGQSGQGGNVRVGGPFFPLMDRRSRHAQIVGQLFLGQGEGLSLLQDDLAKLHRSTSLSLVSPS